MTVGYLLDTNVISEIMRLRPAPQVIAFLEGKRLETLRTSDIVMAELMFGAQLVESESRREGIIAAIDERIRPMFAERILSASEQTWIIWKRIEHTGRIRRYTFPQPDLVIAALAIEHDLSVVTRDDEPFRAADASVINPWLEV